MISLGHHNILECFPSHQSLLGINVQYVMCPSITQNSLFKRELIYQPFWSIWNILLSQQTLMVKNVRCRKKLASKARVKKQYASLSLLTVSYICGIMLNANRQICIIKPNYAKWSRKLYKTHSPSTRQQSNEELWTFIAKRCQPSPPQKNLRLMLLKNQNSISLCVNYYFF